MVGEQRADSSLADLYDRVLSGDDQQETATACFFKDSLLTRKWLLCCRLAYEQSVLKVAHDDSGNSGARKRYDQHFFAGVPIPAVSQTFEHLIIY